MMRCIICLSDILNHVKIYFSLYFNAQLWAEITQHCWEQQKVWPFNESLPVVIQQICGVHVLVIMTAVLCGIHVG